MRESLSPIIEPSPFQMGEHCSGIAEMIFPDWETLRAWWADEEVKKLFKTESSFRDDGGTRVFTGEMVVFVENGKAVF